MTTTALKEPTPPAASTASGLRKGQLVLLAVAAVGSEVLAVALVVDAFREVGSAVYSEGRAPQWASVALPLAGAGLLGAAASAAGGRLGVELSMWSRRRTLRSALSADGDTTRREGPGEALVWALDGDLVGSFLVATGPAGVLGLVEVAAALAILASTPLAPVALALVGLAVLAGALAAGRVHRGRQEWTRSRGRITGRLVERLGAPETIAVQDDPEAAAREGRSLLRHHRTTGRRMDTASAVLAAVPAVVFVGLVTIAIAARGGGDPMSAETGLAITLAGALLVASGLDRMARVALDVVGALDAHRGIARMASTARSAVKDPVEVSGTVLLECEGVSVEHPGGGGVPGPIDLAVRPGDRVVLVGPSGCGKTTLAEVLSSQRPATTGTVRHKPGVVVARVPQAGDDHIFQASLLFNVLCQKKWPPSGTDIDDAETLLNDLGLGPLLDKMPAGISQPIGDGGWRLSSGEAARVSLARALARRPDVVILDETVAALDRVSGTRALEVAASRASATILIAHP